MEQLKLEGLTVIDGMGRPPLEATAITITDGKLAGIGAAPSGAFAGRALDLKGKYAIPGIIDTHVHFCSFEHDRQVAPDLQYSESALALAGSRNAAAALLHGVTTMRDLGASNYTNIKLRDLIEAGYIPGPRVLACGYALAQTGGHGTPGISIEVDGADEVRKAARRMWKMGADCIKLMANGLSVNSPQLSAMEMGVAVEVAHDAGLKVAAHASVWKAVEYALAAGVDTIEHGYTLNEAMVDQMLAQGTILVPTFGTVSRIERVGAEVDGWKDKMDAIRQRMITAMESFRLAHARGVPFALGTDGSNRPLLRVGEVLEEMQALASIGLSNMEILQAATQVAARAIGKEEELGTLQAGKAADVVILNRNPLTDITAVDDIFMVIKGGRPVVQEGRLLS